MKNASVIRLSSFCLLLKITITSVSFSSYTKETLYPKPIIHWQMEDNISDSIAENHISGMGPGVSFSNKSIEGSYSLSFDATSKWSRARINDSKVTIKHLILEEYTSRTYSLWFYAIPNIFQTDDNLEQCLMELGNQQTGISIYLIENMLHLGMIVPKTDSRRFSRLNIQTHYTPNKWNHLVFCIHNGIATLYLNNQIIANKPLDKNIKKIPDMHTSSAFGRVYGTAAFLKGKTGESPYNGLLDDVRIYDIALSQNQVQKLFLEHSQKHTPTPSSPNTIQDQRLASSHFQPSPEENPQNARATNLDQSFKITLIGSALLVIGAISAGIAVFVFVTGKLRMGS